MIRPACEKAGFEPIRADESQTTNLIALDIIKLIVDCDIAICDVSSKNPNVLYELGIRQAFNLPVTIIRDGKTERIFDIQSLRDVTYDEFLRIDHVEIQVEDIAKTLKNTYEGKDKEVNPLASLLGIEPAKKGKEVDISPEMSIVLNELRGIGKRISQLENKEINNPSLSVEKFSIDRWLGRVVDTNKYGKGTVIGAGLTIDGGSVIVKFGDNLERRFLVRGDDLVREIKFRD